MRAACRFVLVAALASSLAARAGAQAANLASLDKEVVDLVKRLAPSVARVGQANSGVVISNKGLVLTDIDVVSRMKEGGAATIEVAVPGAPPYLASIAATDEATSTAILRIDADRNFPSVRPGNPAELEIGHLVLTIGNSFGSANENSPATTLGVLCAIHVDRQGNCLRLETSAATNPGQEGGPYFNLHGDLIGLEFALPRGDDLATLTPIDRIIARYAAMKDFAGAFQKPRVLTPPATLSESLSQAFAIAARRARAGVVTVLVELADPNATAPDFQGVPARKGPVSGTVVDPSGIVVAPLSAFQLEFKSIRVVTHDGRRLPAILLGKDHKAGLAALQAEVGDAPLPVLPPQTSDQLQLGQFCLALGAPDDLDAPIAARAGFVTAGILSAKHQLDAYRDALQTDAGVGVKNAGGALVDLRGRFLGVVLPPAMPFGQNSGLGFAMPAEAVLANLPRWKSGTSCEPAMIGAVLSDGAGGVRVDSVSAGQPAAAAGVLANDVITHLDGVRVDDRQAFSDYLAKHKCAGDSLKLTLQRGKEVLSISLVLGKRG